MVELSIKNKKRMFQKGKPNMGSVSYIVLRVSTVWDTQSNQYTTPGTRASCADKIGKHCYIISNDKLLMFYLL